MLEEDVEGYVEFIRNVNEVLHGSSQAVEFDYEDGNWKYEGVEQDPDRFEEMMKYRAN